MHDWLAAGHHGEMDYMARHAALRTNPALLKPGTTSIITAMLCYGPDTTAAIATLARKDLGYVSRYALGRDYHKTLRQRLQTLAEQIATITGPFNYRVFVDSAPVMEIDLALQAGLGWRGKQNLLLSREGSWHFLGEIFTDLPLPTGLPENLRKDHTNRLHRSSRCGNCVRCITACPTGAIIAPYKIDARRCISYLTLELKGAIPEEFRPLIGNRIAGCDDCQLSCPWNRFTRKNRETDFAVRHALDNTPLVELFAWNEDDFNHRLAGSALRRIGYIRWMRNIAVALGNAPATKETIRALKIRSDHSSALLREHVTWALQHIDRNTKPSNQNSAVTSNSGVQAPSRRKSPTRVPFNTSV